MRKRIYNGCDNAASATAKIVFDWGMGKSSTFFWGNEEEAVDYLNNLKREGYKTFTYKIYLRELNWETETMGGWFCVETGSKTHAQSSISI